MSNERHWSIGFFRGCPHRPICAHVYATEGGNPITSTCSGLSLHDAVTIVASVNMAGCPMEEVDAEVRRLDDLARATLRGTAS